MAIAKNTFTIDEWICDIQGSIVANDNTPVAKTVFNTDEWICDVQENITCKGGSSSQQTTTQNTAPWAEQAPYLTYGFGEAQNNYINNPPQYYPGPTYVPMSGDTDLGLRSIMSEAGSGVPTTNRTLGMLNDTAGGSYLNANAGNPYLTAMARGMPTTPGTMSLTQTAMGGNLNGNPYLDNMMDAASKGIVRNYQTAVAPNVDSTFTAGGRYGSGSWENAKQGAETALAGTLADTATNIYGQNYQQERQNQLQASSLLSQLGLQGAQGLSTNYTDARTDQMRGAALVPGLEQTRFLPAQMMVDAGQQRESYDQAQVADAVNRWNFSQQSPYNTLAQYMGLVQGNYGGQGSVTQPVNTNRAAGVLGGAASGAGMGMMFGGPWGAAAGAVGGGLLGLF